MRMLDELEAVVRPRTAERSSTPPGWLIALLAGGVALAAAVWWATHRSTPAPSAAPQAEATAPKLQLTAAAPTPAAAPEAAASVAAVTAAVIETVAAAPGPAAEPTAEPTPGPAAQPTPSVVPAPKPAAAPAVRPPARGPTATPAVARKPEGRVTTVVTSSGGKWTTTVADASSTEVPGPRAARTLAQGSGKPLGSPAAAVSGAAPSDDADVKLLSALLAHVASAGQGAPLAEDDQLTIAQVVKRCDARPAAEVRECRRRICEGYWGKADACPAPAAARKG